MDDLPAICMRIRIVREARFGHRGRARFATALGIGASTYANYELGRVPPADLLARVVEVTGTSLEWLITGKGEPFPVPDHSTTSVEATRQMVPVVGCTSAGTARYWSELETSQFGPEADARLDSLIATDGEPVVAARARFDRQTPARLNQTISLVQFSSANAAGIIEFLDAPKVRAQHPQAVAWRIDGESMSPRYLDGDLVVTSAAHPAEPGYPCVVRQRDQIGVNCKVYQVHGGRVHLIPINEQYPTQAIDPDSIVWAHRVLYSVRLK